MSANRQLYPEQMEEFPKGWGGRPFVSFQFDALSNLLSFVFLGVLLGPKLYRQAQRAQKPNAQASRRWAQEAWDQKEQTAAEVLEMMSKNNHRA